MTDYTNKYILILGMGKSGQSLATFLHSQEAQLILFDDHKKNQSYLDRFITSDISQIDFTTLECVATSPGVSPHHPVCVEAQRHGVPILSEIEIGLKHLKNPTIAITGTNGKTTLVHLIEHLLNKSQIPAKAVGNNGVPITSLIGHIDEARWLIVEVSSYQIDQLKEPCFDFGLILNISEDHIDRYKTLENYARSKLRLESLLHKSGRLWVSRAIQKEWRSLMSLDASAYEQDYESLLKTASPSAQHMLKNVDENIQAALVIVCALGLELDSVVKHLETFPGIEHRCEYVLTHKGVHFFNDSKGTNVQAMIRALERIQTPIYLIMGGDDKGLDYSPLKPYFFKKVKEIFFIGESQEKMAKVFEKDYSVCLCHTLKEAVQSAYERCPSSATVLLSPGTSSFTMFDNFEHRGREFKKIVKELAGERE